MPSVNLAVSPSAAPPRGFAGHADEETNEGNFGFLILDSTGVIFKCNHSAARILGSKVSDIQGTPLCSLIADMALNNLSASFNARYLTHLSHNGKWRRFHANDRFGRHVPVEMAISKIGAEGSSLFLIHLRQPAGV